MSIRVEKNIILFILIALLLVIAGCQENSAGDSGSEENTSSETSSDSTIKDSEKEESKDETANNQTNEKILEEIQSAPPIPETIENLVAYPVGKFANMNSTSEEVSKHLKSLPPLSEDATEEEMEQYLNYLYSLFKIHYQSPESLIESFTILNAENPEEHADKEIQKEQYNVIVSLDASGSMGNYIGNKTMMDIAKQAILEYVEALPEDANIGLRVYGHEGTSSESDKQLSCKANELIYEMGPYDKNGFGSALDPIQPSGWTPLAGALEQSANDLKQFSAENSRNIIYFVSDGIETCDGNPVEAAKAVKDLGIDPIVNIIGFGVNSDESKQLKQIADAAGGNYADAQNQAQLREQFSKSIDEVLKWQAWHTKTKSEIISNYHENFFGVNGWKNTWLLSNPELFLFLQSAVTILSNEGLITYDQMYWMQDRLRDKKDIQEQEVHKLADTLFELNQENYDAKMDEVYEIYKKND